jgi:SAM-dependent methyltransferase
MKENVLFISGPMKNCGVYQFGYRIGMALKQSSKYSFIYVECSSEKELKNLFEAYSPVCMIYNYQGDTMKWLRIWMTNSFKAIQIGIIHEITQEIADTSSHGMFDYYIAPDPTLILKNPLVYKTGRLVIPSKLTPRENNIPVIGTFGFGSKNKNFSLVVKSVCEEFDEAKIRINIAFAEFGDKSGNSALQIAEECREIVRAFPKIDLKISHDFLEESDLLKFLNENSLNVFLYSDDGQRGISSVIDYALAVDIPIAVSSNSCMFRHIDDSHPSIVFEKGNTLKKIMTNGPIALRNVVREFSSENLVWEYERIVEDVLNRTQKNKKYGMNIFQQRFIKILKKILKKYLLNRPSHSTSNWSDAILNYLDNRVVYDPEAVYKPIEISSNILKYNRILDDAARISYKPAIYFLKKHVPFWISRKVDRANIQQAFVFDTVIRLSGGVNSQKVLSVGCFEDTAFAALKKLGYKIDGIDPVINYDLQTYLTKPSINKYAYDIVFSTSVIEHVKNDFEFLKKMFDATREGGHIVLTCDFKEGYKEGDEKPDCNYRFYTEQYIHKLIEQIPGCVFVDKPNWSCPSPDFDWAGFKYTFASIVLKRV